MAEAKPFSSWYANPHRSSGQYLYQVAEGTDMQDAFNNALNLMASTLSVTIASNTKAISRTVPET